MFFWGAEITAAFWVEDLWQSTNPPATDRGAPGFLWPQLLQCTPWWTSFVMAHRGVGRNSWWFALLVIWTGPVFGFWSSIFSEKKSSILWHKTLTFPPFFLLLPFFGLGHHLIPFDHPPPLWWLIPGEGRLAADGDRAIDLNYLSHLAPWTPRITWGESCKITSFNTTNHGRSIGWPAENYYVQKAEQPIFCWVIFRWEIAVVC